MQTSAVPNMAVSSSPPHPPYTLHPTTPLNEVHTAATYTGSGQKQHSMHYQIYVITALLMIVTARKT